MSINVMPPTSIIFAALVTTHPPVMFIFDRDNNVDLRQEIHNPRIISSLWIPII
jgi:hypothetical protein